MGTVSTRPCLCLDEHQEEAPGAPLIYARSYLRPEPLTCAYVHLHTSLPPILTYPACFLSTEIQQKYHKKKQSIPNHALLHYKRQDTEPSPLVCLLVPTKTTTKKPQALTTQKHLPNNIPQTRRAKKPQKKHYYSNPKKKGSSRAKCRRSQGWSMGGMKKEGVGGRRRREGGNG